jgi:flagellar hook-basal body protein
LSLYSALYAGVSGLSAQASAMATVADNITNINTVGYKGVEAQFRTMVTDGRAKSNYSAGGVAAAPVSMVSKQGLLQASGSSTDLAIDGGGFFVTRASSDSSGDVAYTRAGAFRPDEEGYLRNPAGLYLYGWRLDATGDYTNTGSVEALEPVRVSDLIGTASPTTRIQARMNLQSTTPNYAGAYTAGDMASGTVTPQFTRSFDVSDSQGGSHRVTMGFIKTGPNTWQSEVYSNPASDVTAAGGLLASGTIRFNGDGSLGADHAGDRQRRFHRRHHAVRRRELADLVERRRRHARQSLLGRDQQGRRGQRDLLRWLDPFGVPAPDSHLPEPGWAHPRLGQRLHHQPRLRRHDAQRSGPARRGRDRFQLAGSLDRRSGGRVHQHDPLPAGL